MKIFEFHLRIMKIINILEFHIRIIKILKNLELHLIIMKIMKIKKNPFDNDENHENLRNPYENK